MRRALRTFWIVGLIALIVALTTTLFLVFSSEASANTNRTIGFQGRLLTSSGGVVPDGNYNLQFKIYEGGSGTNTLNPDGELVWTETYRNQGSLRGVTVRNGHFSVSLGSQTPFGDSVDWSHDTLWLSLNVAGRADDCVTFGLAPCAADGEMLPMKAINAVPYAMSAGSLGGRTADQFLQLGQGVQNDASASSSIHINKTGTGDLLQFQNNSVDVLTVTNSGDLVLGANSSDKTISVATPSSGDGSGLTIAAGDGGTTGAGGDLILQGGNAGAGTINGGGVAIDAGAGSGTGSGGEISIGASNASNITIGNLTSNITTTLAGDTVIKPITGSDSVSAFQLQRANGTTMLAADSVNQTITIGNAAAGNAMVVSTSTGQVTYYGSARNTRHITLSAEYGGAVLNAGTGVNNTGTMTSSVDLTNRMNYYKWTTSQGTNQSYDVVVQVPLPADFDGWASTHPLSVSTYTSNTSSGTILLEARDSQGNVHCNFVSVTPSSTNTWATNNMACTLNTGIYTAGDHMTLRLRMQSPNAGDVRIGDIKLSYLSRF